MTMAKSDPAVRRITKQGLPALRMFGLAVEYFPHYLNRTIELHTLDVVLLSFIVRGRGRHLIDDETFTESGSSLAVTHYDQRHCILTDARGMEIFNIYLDLRHHPLPVLPRELQPVLPLLLPLHPRFQHRLNRIVRLQFDDPQPPAQILFFLQRELQTRDAGYEQAVALLWKYFLILGCRRALQNGFVPPREPVNLPRRRLEAVRQYIDQAYHEPHTLGSLAQRAQLSRTYLCRGFKAYTGKRLFDYLIERRIQAAMIRLRGGDEKVLAVALNCGFHDMAYFNRKFKQIVGLTPTAYRHGPTRGREKVTSTFSIMPPSPHPPGDEAANANGWASGKMQIPSPRHAHGPTPAGW